jgi:hypothetical protein
LKNWNMISSSTFWCRIFFPRWYLGVGSSFLIDISTTFEDLSSLTFQWLENLFHFQCFDNLKRYFFIDV